MGWKQADVSENADNIRPGNPLGVEVYVMKNEIERECAQKRSEQRAWMSETQRIQRREPVIAITEEVEESGAQSLCSRTLRGV